MNKIRRKHKQKVRKYKSALILVMGIVILTSTLLYYFMDNNSSAYDEGPLVLFACNYPNQKLDILANVEEDGGTLIHIVAENIQHDDLTIWIRILDLYDFSWKCEGDMKEIALNGMQNEYVAIETGKMEGHGKEAVFSISYPMNYYSVIKLKSDNFISASNDMCCVRLPWLAQWASTTTKNFLLQNRSVGIDDENIINTKINEESLYVPLSVYTVLYPDLSLLKSNYNLNYVEPEPISIGAYLMWRESMFFYPRLKYKVENNAVNDVKGNVIAGLIGIGFSTIYEFVKARKESE